MLEYTSSDNLILSKFDQTSCNQATTKIKLILLSYQENGKI